MQEEIITIIFICMSASVMPLHSFLVLLFYFFLILHSYHLLSYHCCFFPSVIISHLLICSSLPLLYFSTRLLYSLIPTSHPSYHLITWFMLHVYLSYVYGSGVSMVTLCFKYIYGQSMFQVDQTLVHVSDVSMVYSMYQVHLIYGRSMFQVARTCFKCIYGLSFFHEYLFSPPTQFASLDALWNIAPNKFGLMRMEFGSIQVYLWLIHASTVSMVWPWFRCIYNLPMF